MNANEIIEKTKEQIEFWKDAKKHSLHFMQKDLDKEVEDYESLLSELYRARIRETAIEQPTMEDADQDGNVLAYDADLDGWIVRPFKDVIISYRQWMETYLVYPRWTCLPREEEVENEV